MKPGDLIILINSNPIAVGSYGYEFGCGPGGDLTLNDEVWVPNGSIGMYCEDPKVDGGKFGVLVNGRLLWFDQLDVRVIDETR
jgi:hypothetical protein